MKKFFEYIQLDKIVFYSIVSTTVLFFFTFFLILLLYRNLPPVLPLFNQLAWGEPRLGVKQEIFIPIGIILCVGITNMLISMILYNTSPLISRILFVTMFLVALFTLLFTSRTILLAL